MRFLRITVESRACELSMPIATNAGTPPIRDSCIKSVHSGERLVWIRVSQYTQYKGNAWYDAMPLRTGIQRCLRQIDGNINNRSVAYDNTIVSTSSGKPNIIWCVYRKAKSNPAPIDAPRKKNESVKISVKNKVSGMRSRIALRLGGETDKDVDGAEYGFSSTSFIAFVCPIVHCCFDFQNDSATTSSARSQMLLRQYLQWGEETTFSHYQYCCGMAR